MDQPLTFEQIRHIVADMQQRRSPVIKMMREILIRVQGEYVIPMPDMKDEKEMSHLTPMLVADAIDSIGSRASSVQPRVMIPAIDEMRDTGVRSKEYAVKRRQMLSACYHKNRWRLKRRRYYRHLSAYQTCSVVVLPDMRMQMPRIEVRDPLHTYVEERSADSQDDPAYVAFITRYSGEYLRRHFPMVCAERGGPITNYDTSQSWDVFEWMDGDQTVFGLLGPQYNDGGNHVHELYRQGPFMQLGGAIPNRLGYLPAMIPQNVSLGSIASRMSSMLGVVDYGAKLMALDMIAQEKATFPDMYAIGREGQLPRLTNGRWQDGREGEINMMEGVERVGMLQQTPDPRTAQAIDRLERNFNRSMGNIPQMSGENPGSLRTGRALDSIASYSVDPRIQELHEITQDWLPLINRGVLDTYRTMWPSKKYEVFSGWPGDEGMLKFEPSKHVETSENTVSYPVPGADLVQLTQILGSLAGTEALSIESMREQHPWIPDAAGEKKRVTMEQLEVAVRQALQMQLTQGAIPIPLAKKIVDHVKKGVDLFDAIENANEELQREQAQEIPEAPEGMQAPPETMPGLAAGPAAALGPAGVDTAPPGAPATDEAGMRQIMAAMMGGQ